MLKELKFLEPAICKNLSRRNLMGIKCTVRAGMLEMISANGFLIKRVVTSTHLRDCDFCIDDDAVRKALKIAGSDQVLIEEDRIKIDNVEIHYSEDSKIMEYPDFSGLINKSYTGVSAALGFNLEYLNIALKNAPKKDSLLKVRFVGTERDDANPIMIEFESGDGSSDYYAYIMPVRLGNG